MFTKVKIFKPEKENMRVIPSINAISLFITSLFYELLNIKMGPGFYKHPVFLICDAKDSDKFDEEQSSFQEQIDKLWVNESKGYQCIKK